MVFKSKRLYSSTHNLTSRNPYYNGKWFLRLVVYSAKAIVIVAILIIMENGF